MRSNVITRNCRAKDPQHCPYHGVLLQMEAAKKNLAFDEYADLREKLRQRLATDEETRREQALDDGVNVEGLSFESVLREQTRTEAMVAAAANTDNTLYVPARPDPAYRPAERQFVPGDLYGSWQGSKHDASLPISTVATQIKRDFQAAQSAGWLPKNLTISAKKDVYSGGRAIRVQVFGVADKDRYEPGLADRPQETPQAVVVRSRVEQLVEAYNYMHRTEPFGLHSADTHFHTDIKILDDRQQAAENAEKAQAANVRQAKKDANDLAAMHQLGGYTALRAKGFAQVGQTRDGRPIMRVPGTSFLGVGTPSPIAANGHTYKLYNLTAISEGAPGALEENLALMSAGRIDAKFRKQRFIG